MKAEQDKPGAAVRWKPGEREIKKNHVIGGVKSRSQAQRDEAWKKHVPIGS